MSADGSSPCSTATSFARICRADLVSVARTATRTSGALVSLPAKSFATAVIVICALVSPYRETRDEVRATIEAIGGPGSFIEVYVDTPLDVVAARDVKGLYAATERGEVQAMTGVSDPYEPPLSPENSSSRPSTEQSKRTPLWWWSTLRSAP